jgi:hypothetical protein
VFTTFKDLRSFFIKHHKDLSSMHMDNDDLSGFFTSVPQERIRSAVTLLLGKYVQMNPGVTYDYCVFTVLVNKGTVEGRVIRGRARTSGSSHLMFLKHLQALVEYCLESSVFVCMGVIFSQCRGACMGNPLVPVLCSLVATVEEFFWRQGFDSVLLSSAFFTRYVDNRLVISHHYVRSHPQMQKFLHLEFYRPPVCLEQVGDNTVLGFEVSLEFRTIRYIVPAHSWQFRSPKSASSDRVLMTSFVTRLHIICRCSYPRSAALSSCKQLMHAYITHGYDQKLLQSQAVRILRRYHLSL